MAGIGFRFREQLGKDTYTGLLRTYLMAGIIGSGPWLISIGSMLFIGFWTQKLGGDPASVKPFLATITYLMATSLITSGSLQLMFVRFVADRLFEEKYESILPNILGAMLLTTAVSGTLGTIATLTLFAESFAFSALLVVAFVTLCNVWVLSALMSGLKAYRTVVAVFGLGYSLTVAGSLGLARFGIAGYMAGFAIGQAVMLFSMLALVIRHYPSEQLIAFQFLNRKKIFPSLALAGIALNGCIWADKFVFWGDPSTSEALMGPIRYSVVYDVPIFLAYASVVPGMAVFFVRIETDFAEACDHFFRAVREGDTLDELLRFRNALVGAARAGIYDICRVQGLAVAVLLLVSVRLLALFDIPAFYSYLFKVDVVGVAFQVVLLGILTILFYLDYRKVVLYLCAFFALANSTLSIASIYLGPRFYGFGFALAAGLTTVLALMALSRRLDRLDFETFMR
jgi:uncharacterized membrane protein